MTRTSGLTRCMAPAARLASGAALLLGFLAAGCTAPREETATGTDRPNIVLIIIDTLRKDYVAAGDDLTGETETPALAGHFRDGYWFPNCQSQSPWTKPSMATLMTGLYPTAHGALQGQIHARDPGIVEDPLRNSLVTVAEALSDSGYETMAVQTNPNLTRELQFDQGFGWFRYENDAPATWVNETALGWLEGGEPPVPAGGAEANTHNGDAAGEAPVFMYLHYMDPHLPYSRHPEESYPPYDGPVLDDMVITDYDQIDFNAQDKAYAEALYRGEVHFVDREVGRFLDRLKSHPLWENTLVVVLSDHGEEFWDHGKYEHGHTVYDELLRVPLFLGGPWLDRYAEQRGGPTPAGGGSAHSFSLQIRIIDLMPTLLELAGATSPPYTQGESFARLFTGDGTAVASRTSFAEGLLYDEQRFGMRTHTHKLIMNIESRTLELYDNASDPDERQDLADRNEAVASRLKGIVARWYAANRELATHFGPEEVIPLTPEQMERLRSLGYVK